MFEIEKKKQLLEKFSDIFFLIVTFLILASDTIDVTFFHLRWWCHFLLKLICLNKKELKRDK